MSKIGEFLKSIKQKRTKKGLSLEEKKDRARFRLIKTIPFIILILSVFIYQMQWISALDNIQLTYDFSQMEKAFDEIDTPEHSQFFTPDFQKDLNEIEATKNPIELLLNSFIGNISSQNISMNINLTESAQILIKNRGQTIQNIENESGQSIENLDDLFNLVGELDSSYFLNFFQEVWQNLVQNLIPESWFKLGNITITNNAWISLKNISFVARFELNNNSIPFLNYSHIQISKYSSFLIKLSLANLFQSLISTMLEWITGITYQYFSNFFNTSNDMNSLRSVSFYIQEVLKDFHLLGIVEFNANFGLLPIDFDFSIDLSSNSTSA